MDEYLFPAIPKLVLVLHATCAGNQVVNGPNDMPDTH